MQKLTIGFLKWQRISTKESTTTPCWER